jgi:hypothetical protein
MLIGFVKLASGISGDYSSRETVVTVQNSPPLRETVKGGMASSSRKARFTLGASSRAIDLALGAHQAARHVVDARRQRRAGRAPLGTNFAAGRWATSGIRIVAAPVAPGYIHILFYAAGIRYPARAFALRSARA